MYQWIQLFNQILQNTENEVHILECVLKVKKTIITTLHSTYLTKIIFLLTN